MSDLAFFGLAPLLVIGALGVVLCRNLYHAAYSLAGVLVTTALLYLALTAPLVAVVQILLYTGGVLTLAAQGEAVRRCARQRLTDCPLN